MHREQTILPSRALIYPLSLSIAQCICICLFGCLFIAFYLSSRKNAHCKTDKKRTTQKIKVVHKKAYGYFEAITKQKKRCELMQKDRE